MATLFVRTESSFLGISRYFVVIDVIAECLGLNDKKNHWKM